MKINLFTRLMCAAMVLGGVPLAAMAQQRTATASRSTSASSSAAASIGVGPFTVHTKQSAFSAKLSRIDKNTLWVLRESSDGTPLPVGVALGDVEWVDVPHPAIFDRALKATTNQFAAAHKGLDAVIAQMRPFQALPGMIMDEAMMIKGQVYAKEKKWKEAIRLFEQVMALPFETDAKRIARIQAGVAYAQLEDHERVVEYLGGIPMPEDDEELLSDMLFALGNAYFYLENYDDALMSYLPLVVFYPYVKFNEARGLEAALGCYAKLEEWEPLYKSIQTIRKEYPDSPASKTTDQFVKDYQQELLQVGEFVDGPTVVQPESSVTK